MLRRYFLSFLMPRRFHFMPIDVITDYADVFDADAASSFAFFVLSDVTTIAEFDYSSPFR